MLRVSSSNGSLTPSCVTSPVTDRDLTQAAALQQTNDLVESIMQVRGGNVHAAITAWLHDTPVTSAQLVWRAVHFNHVMCGFDWSQLASQEPAGYRSNLALTDFTCGCSHGCKNGAPSVVFTQYLENTTALGTQISDTWHVLDDTDQRWG